MSTARRASDWARWAGRRTACCWMARLLAAMSIPIFGRQVARPQTRAGGSPRTTTIAFSKAEQAEKHGRGRDRKCRKEAGRPCRKARATPKMTAETVTWSRVVRLRCPGA